MGEEDLFGIPSQPCADGVPARPDATAVRSGLNPYPITPPVLSGHADGFCLRHGGEILDVFPDFEGVSEGFRAACVGLVLLQEVFAAARVR